MMFKERIKNGEERDIYWHQTMELSSKERSITWYYDTEN